MAHYLRAHLLNNLSLSIFALVFAFGIWSILSRSTKITSTLPATVYFYNSSDKKINAPEQLPITVYGKRSDLKKYMHTFAVHIDASTYKKGSQTITLNKTMVHIPDSIIVLNYTPELAITVQSA